MQSKQPIKKLLENEYSLKQALALGAFEDQSMEAMIDDDFISLEELNLDTSSLSKSTLKSSNLDSSSPGDEK